MANGFDGCHRSTQQPDFPRIHGLRVRIPEARRLSLYLQDVRSRTEVYESGERLEICHGHVRIQGIFDFKSNVVQGVIRCIRHFSGLVMRMES